MARAASHITGSPVPDVEGRRRVVVEHLSPCVDGGRFCVKRVAGDHVEVTADVFADGHDVVAAVVRHRPDGERRHREVRMRPVGNDRFAASFPVEVLGRHSYAVRAWIDRFATWRDELRRRLEAGQDVRVELAVGAGLVEAAAAGAPAAAATELRRWGDRLTVTDAEAAAAAALDPALAGLMKTHDPRPHHTDSDLAVPVWVERPLARLSGR
jgi:starch synthase (maltosyl-transferring)